jgi:hypothetical protein
MKNTKATKVDENLYDDFFVLFVSFVVKLIFGCSMGRDVFSVVQDEPFQANE